MFGKKKCKKCGEKISSDFNYCPYCRTPLKNVFENAFEEEEDWGLLGKDDNFEPEEIRISLGLSTLFNSLIKSLNKQIKEFDKKNLRSTEPKMSKKGEGISISISSFSNGKPEIKVSGFGNISGFNEEEQQIKRKKPVLLPISNPGKFAGLPKKEPKTEIRRLSNKVIYEIKLPGVKSIKDISIIQLENSIEIKALAGKKVFYKIIPISLPINKYNLSQGILTLELDSKD